MTQFFFSEANQSTYLVVLSKEEKHGNRGEFDAADSGKTKGFANWKLGPYLGDVIVVDRYAIYIDLHRSIAPVARRLNFRKWTAYEIY